MTCSLPHDAIRRAAVNRHAARRLFGVVIGEPGIFRCRERVGYLLRRFDSIGHNHRERIGIDRSGCRAGKHSIH